MQGVCARYCNLQPSFLPIYLYIQLVFYRNTFTIQATLEEESRLEYTDGHMFSLIVEQEKQPRLLNANAS